MATTRKRAAVVTLDGLEASIDKAVSLAQSRHGATFEPGTIAINWEIFGRKIKAIKPGAENSRLDVATTMVASMKLPSSSSPVVIRWDKWVLVGFWDPSRGQPPIEF